MSLWSSASIPEGAAHSFLSYYIVAERAMVTSKVLPFDSLIFILISAIL